MKCRAWKIARDFYLKIMAGPGEGDILKVENL